MITGNPLFSWPSRLATGTSTLSNSMYVEPLKYNQHDPCEISGPPTTGMNTGVLNLATSHTRYLHRDNQRRDTSCSCTASSHGRSAIISKDTVGNPLLGSVDNVHVALALGGGSQASNIGASYRSQAYSQHRVCTRLNPSEEVLTIRLSHTQTESVLPLQHIRKESPLLLLIPKIDDWRTTDRIATTQSPDHAQIPATGNLINDDNIVKPVPLPRVDISRKSLAIQIIGGQRERSYSCVPQLGMAFVDLSSMECSGKL